MNRFGRRLFNINFPTRLTQPWPGAENDILRAVWKPRIIADLHTPSPLIALLDKQRT